MDMTVDKSYTDITSPDNVAKTDRNVFNVGNGLLYSITCPNERRKPNWTESETRYLIKLYRQNRNILNYKRSNGVSNITKIETWRSMTDQLNKRFPNAVQRTKEELKRKWKNLVHLSRKDAMELRNWRPDSDLPMPKPLSVVAKAVLQLNEDVLLVQDGGEVLSTDDMDDLDDTEWDEALNRSATSTISSPSSEHEQKCDDYFQPLLLKQEPVDDDADDKELSRDSNVSEKVVVDALPERERSPSPTPAVATRPMPTLLPKPQRTIPNQCIVRSAANVYPAMSAPPLKHADDRKRHLTTSSTVSNGSRYNAPSYGQATNYKRTRTESRDDASDDEISTIKKNKLILETEVLQLKKEKLQLEIEFWRSQLQQSLR